MSEPRATTIWNIKCPNCNGRGRWWCQFFLKKCFEQDKECGISWATTGAQTGQWKRRTSDDFLLQRLGPSGTHEHKCMWCYGHGKVSEKTNEKWHTERVVKALVR